MYNRSGTWQRISRIGHSVKFIFTDEKSKPPEFLFFVFAFSFTTLDFSYKYEEKGKETSLTYMLSDRYWSLKLLQGKLQKRLSTVKFFVGIKQLLEN